MRQRRRGPEPADGPAEDRDLGPDADPEAVAREIVLRKLTAQARSRGELAKALAQRRVPEQTAAEVLDRFEEVGLVDDAAFAESWVRSRQSRRHLSKRVLRQELVRKGVERENIDNALEQIDPDDEYAAARDLAAKKYRTMAGLDRAVAYRRLAGALGRRGFGPGTVSRVLAEVLDGPPSDDSFLGDTPEVSNSFDS
jgi:regulatory protein